MRVLVVSAWPSWPLDGARMILHHHLRHWVDRHDLTVLAASRLPGDEIPAGASTGYRFEWHGARRRGPREYARRRWASLRTGEPANVFRVEVPGLLAALDRELTENRPDVVHLLGSGTAQLVARTRAAGVPAVHMPIDAWRLAYNNLEHVPVWRRLIEIGQRRKVVRHEARHLPDCFAVVVVADGDAALLRAAVPGVRVDVVPNGIEAGPAPPAPADAPVLGIHGAMSTRPNRDAAIALVGDVLPLVQARHPSARALVIGRDPAPDVLRLAGPAVEVTGEVGDIRQALARVAVYVAPMTNGSGIKNKVLEAMAAGLPVVSTRLGLDGIGAGPGVVAADTPAAMAAVVSDLLADPSARLRLGAEGRRRVVEDFRWDRSAGTIEALWAEAAAANSPTRGI